jgi:hypothetical protein
MPSTIHFPDTTTLPAYIDRSDPGTVANVELGGIRTALAVPMLRENELIGSFWSLSCGRYPGSGHDGAVNACVCR